MSVTLDISVDAKAVVAGVESLRLRLATALVSGLRSALEMAAGSVVSTAASKGLRSRTGTLLNEVEGRIVAEDELRGEVGVLDEGSPAMRYAYLLLAGSKDIRPVNADALTIPVGKNLTGAGVARYPTVAALKAAFGEKVFFAKRFVGVHASKFRDEIYFILSGGVTVKGVDALGPGVQAAVPGMMAEVQREVDAAVAEAT